MLKSITTPLGFFWGSLLIVESFLGVTVIRSSADYVPKIVLLGACLFLVVVTVVAILVWCKPHNLIYDKEAHLKTKVFGTESEAASRTEVPSEEK